VLWALLSSLVAAALIVAAIVIMQSRSDTTGTVVADGSTGTTLATPQTEEQRIVAAYKGYWAAVDKASAAPVDPNSPAIGAYATGAQLQAAVDALRQKAAGGLAGRYPANSVHEQRPRVVQISGDRAGVQSCDIDDGYVVNMASGAPVGPTGVETLLVNAQLIREGVNWKVAGLQFAKSWKGVAGCAVGQS